ncbi:hypothetical protein TRICI_001073 [Trichomonascus ciferrii]|uniref:F-box domain-containing protein n=1 Tax=Trichomonascus ciferrii TaxID=44093 RepID=A0A642VCM4_9ASCO|nr:hypothetical protein TRICI_001073 [Trichomonascus ciferrii]
MKRLSKLWKKGDKAQAPPSQGQGQGNRDLSNPEAFYNALRDGTLTMDSPNVTLGNTTDPRGTGVVGPSTIGDIYSNVTRSQEKVSEVKPTAVPKEVVVDSTKPRLPNEIVSMIMDYMDPYDLVPMRKTCVDFFDLASTRLYKEMHITCERVQGANRDACYITVYLGNMTFLSIRNFLHAVQKRILTKAFQYVKVFKVTSLSIDTPYVPQSANASIDTESLVLLLNWFAYVLSPLSLPAVKTVDIVFTVTIDGRPPQFESVINALAKGFPNAEKIYALNMTVLTTFPLPRPEILKEFRTVSFRLTGTNPSMITTVCRGPLPSTFRGLSIMSPIITSAETLKNLFSGTPDLNSLALSLSREITQLQPNETVDFLPKSVTSLALTEDPEGPFRNTPAQTFTAAAKYPAENVQNLYIVSDTGYSIRQFKFQKVKYLDYRSTSREGSLSPQFLPTFKTLAYNIREHIVTLRLALDVDLLNALIHSFTPFPPNLKHAVFSTTGSFVSVDTPKSPYKTTEKATLVLLTQMTYHKVGGFMSHFLNYTPVYLDIDENWNRIDPYCRQFLTHIHADWYQVDRDLYLMTH